MMWYGNGMGGWGLALMMVGNVLFWAVVILGGVALIRYLAAGNRTGPGRGPLPSNCSPSGSLGARSTSRSTDPPRHADTRTGHVSNADRRTGRGRGRRSAFTPALAYSVFTPVYDLALEVLGFGRSFKAAVAKLAEVQPGETVLDLGCGTGTLLHALVARQPGARFTGIDPDRQVLAIARRRLQSSAPTVELVEGYAQDLPFPDRAFDLVISTLIFHHLPDPVKVAALGEVRRVLAPHGRFLLVDFGAPPTRVAQVLLTIGSVFDGRDNMRANLAGELPEMLAAAGFDVTEISRPHRGVRHLLARPRSTPAS